MKVRARTPLSVVLVWMGTQPPGRLVVVCKHTGLFGSPATAIEAVGSAEADVVGRGRKSAGADVQEQFAAGDDEAKQQALPVPSPLTVTEVGAVPMTRHRWCPWRSVCNHSRRGACHHAGNRHRDGDVAGAFQAEGCRGARKRGQWRHGGR